jgi:hypothetical protein
MFWSVRRRVLRPTQHSFRPSLESLERRDAPALVSASSFVVPQPLPVGPPVQIAPPPPVNIVPHTTSLNVSQA